MRESAALFATRLRIAAPLLALASCMAAAVAAPIGSIDTPAADAFPGPRVRLTGWAHDSGGIRRVEVRWHGGKREARMGIERADVAAARPELRAAAKSGWEFEHDLAETPAPPGWDRRRIEVVAVGNDGRETRLGVRDVIDPAAFTRWGGSRQVEPFYLLPATSGVAVGGAGELDGAYRAYLGGSVAIGVRVPILYMRTTLGRARDFAFDPRWDVERRCGERRIADDALAPVLEHAAAKRLALLVTLNGGIWADASCDVPAWDVNDHLEADPANCQWNERGAVERDDALRNLPGSQHSPELARALTLNVYAADVRRYKKRNLQQAARLVARFDRDQPGLLVGVSLDPDVYVNPFHDERQWYDYNPGTIRQFRHWLAGTGPYAGRSEPGVPDLRAWRRAEALTLERAGALAGRVFGSWDEVDPPRKFPRTAPSPFWKDPWVHEWEAFRRHLVHLHYDELAAWAAEAGLDPKRIWSAQGFMPPHAGAMPLIARLASPVRNYDSGGASVEGSKPRAGHLGAIVYGATATNDSALDDGQSLFAAFAATDRGWAAVEFNTASLRHAAEPATAAQAHRALSRMWNHGARFASPMAWNGSNGIYAGQPGYVAYTSWRNTPLEEAAKDFMLARFGLPRGARLWTFGTPAHADRDGWSAAFGTIEAQRASLRIAPGAGARAVIDSPRELALSGAARVVVLEATGAALPIEVWGRAASDPPWRWTMLGRGDAKGGVAIGTLPGGVDQLRLALAIGRATTVTRIAALPVGK